MMKEIEMPKDIAKHLEQYKRSQLTQAEYCRSNKLSYHKFGYWRRKNNKSSEIPLVPVKLETVERTTSALCTLTFNHGVCLEVYDVPGLSHD